MLPENSLLKYLCENLNCNIDEINNKLIYGTIINEICNLKLYSTIYGPIEVSGMVYTPPYRINLPYLDATYYGFKSFNEYLKHVFGVELEYPELYCLFDVDIENGSYRYHPLELVNIYEEN